MIKRIAFTLVALAIFLTHIIFAMASISEATSLTNSLLLALLVVAVGILFSIKD